MIVCAAPQRVTKIASGLHSFSSIDYSPRSTQLLFQRFRLRTATPLRCSVIFWTLHSVSKSQVPDREISFQSRVNQTRFCIDFVTNWSKPRVVISWEIALCAGKHFDNSNAPSRFFKATTIFLLEFFRIQIKNKKDFWETTPVSTNQI